MRNRKISNRIATAILAGRAPESRPDLTPLADSIAEFREAAYETTARPSEELMVRLGLAEAPAALSHHKSLPTIGAKKRGIRMFSWIAGLGLAAKIALGASVAAAATVGAGAGGLLPLGAQDTFDTVVSTVISPPEDGGTLTEDTTITPEPEVTDDTTATPEPEATEEADATEHPDNFGGLVSERAQDPDKDGRTFGTETSEAAHENGKQPNTESSSDELSSTESSSTELSSDDQDSPEAADNDSDDSADHGKPETKQENKQGGTSKP